MSNSTSELRIEKEAASNILARTLRVSIIITLVLAAITYVAMAGTLARFVYTDIGVEYVATPKFKGGIAEAGSVVIIEAGSENSFTFVDNLITSFTPHNGTAKVVIQEGNYGTPDWLAYGIEPTETGNLTDQYIGQCIAGCAEGEFIVFDAATILGSLGKES